MTTKPQRATDYRPEETAQVRAACLTVAARLGDLLDDVRIVGGLIPSLIIDPVHDPADDEAAHVGTTDLDVGLSVALMDDARYTAVADRLRNAGFAPDRKQNGNIVRQRWRLGELKVTVDFLIAPLSTTSTAGQLQDLTEDLAAFVIPGLELAFAEYVEVDLDGQDLAGDRMQRQVRVAGPGAFTVLKALAFRGRAEPKDAYDLSYVLQRWPSGIVDVARRIADHVARSPQCEAVVLRALTCLEEDFASSSHTGPGQVARFLADPPRARDAVDARGAVDDLLRACRKLGLVPTSLAS